MHDDKIILKAIKVSQPLADFYVAKISARDLKDVSFVELLEYMDENGRLKGHQRQRNTDRLKQIGRFINSVEMTFPASIIIAANYSEEGRVVDETDEARWEIIPINDDDDSIVKISIPKHKKLAAIIDGQHRLLGFDYADDARKDIDIVCSIFFDLPNSYQAYLFATINGNQKRVDRSLALEQFGFNVEDEPESSWTPEKLAVYLTRKLNFSKDSPLFGRVKLAPVYLGDTFKNIQWYVSTSTIVDAFLSLISSNPKRDRVEMAERHIFKGRNRKQLSVFKDTSPLRELYLNNQDNDIYVVVSDFFNSVKRILWDNQPQGSYLFKTVGIQALIDLLKKIVQTEYPNINIDFDKYLSKAANIDWTDNYFSLAGTGRTRAKRVLFYAIGFDLGSKVQDNDMENIKRLVRL